MSETETGGGVTSSEVDSAVTAGKNAVKAEVRTVLLQMLSAIEAPSDAEFRSRLVQIRSLLSSF
jgi:hypothetical protein